MSRTFEFDCPLPQGLHARPATALAAVCEPFDSAITVRNLRTGADASARSVLALISADIRDGDRCAVTIAGGDADAAHDALRDWVDAVLPNCDDAMEAGDAAGEPVALPPSLAELNPTYLSGIAVSAGIGCGAPVILSGPQVPAELLAQSGPGAERTWRELAAAKAEVTRQLETELGRRRGAEASVLRAHLAILQDEEYVARLQDAAEAAEADASPARAIAAVVEHFDGLLAETGNPYLLERALDIQDVSQRLMRVIYGAAAHSPVPALGAASIVVADHLTPGDFIALNGPLLEGLVLESAGRTSHTVLLARAAEVPVLTGMPNAVDFARRAGTALIVDADAGVLLRADGAAIDAYYRRERQRLEAIAERFAVFARREIRTLDGERLDVAANIALPDEAGPAFEKGAGGIGVFRTEMLFVGRPEPPGEDEQYAAYRRVLQAADGRPVIVRTFDVGGDKPVAWLEDQAEENPFLGVRGVRLYSLAESVFRTQIRALLRAAAHGDLRIMLPMISTPGELRWARAVLEEERAALDESGARAGSVLLGIMIEVPAAVYAIDKLAPISDFFSIGSNDLAQYFMAADRGNDRVKQLYDPFQPAFLRFLKDLVDAAKRNGVHTGLCGDMASDEAALPLLTGLGLDEISLTAPQIPRTKAALAQLDASDCRRLLERVIECEDGDGVRSELESAAARATGRSLFAEDLVLFAERANSKVDAIKQLVDRAHLAGRARGAAALESAIWQREDVFSTGLGFGIAIPHCKSAAVRHNSLCIARYATPLDWQSRDGQPVDTVIMLIIREGDAGEQHMKIFAQLARRIMHEDFRDGLRACTDAPSLLRFLQDAVET